jgi:hypothetical protein
MSDAPDSPDSVAIADAIQRIAESDALAQPSDPLSAVGANLHQLAGELDESPERYVIALLGHVASYWLRPDDWATPYGPGITIYGVRTEAAHDLNEYDLATLALAAPLIPSALLRSRALDVLFVRADGARRPELAIAHLEAILEAEISDESWLMNMSAWERAVIVGRRLNAATRPSLDRLITALQATIQTTQGGLLALRIAELLQRNSLGRDSAAAVATRLQQIASTVTDRDLARAYHSGAAAWFKLAGDTDSAYVEIEIVIRTLVADAESISEDAGTSAGARASHLFELAIREIRSLPTSARIAHNLMTLPAQLARRIREVGAAQLGRMRAFTSEPVDLTQVARSAVDHVSNHDAPEAIARFVGLADIANFDSDKRSAEELNRRYPFSSIFSHVLYAPDGRVVYRSDGHGGKPIYGTDPAIWRQMVRAYELRIGLLVQGLIWPAYVQLSNEHRLTADVFEMLVLETPLVPKERSGQFSKGLYYGYTGDFSTAMQLLVPQIENLVRHHLGNAGISTTHMDNGVELEVGLSKLMERAGVEEVFGQDLCFEIRALLCGALGPNLRNQAAHGLLSDQTAAAGASLYLWWFALRLIYIHFWNSVHDTQATEAREPAERDDDPEIVGD